MTNEDLQKLGAEACARGLGELDNPFYRPENMPAVTGDDIVEYARKAENWHLGWLVESCMQNQKQ